jgi:ElaB/YqjD/DUF883 family membrane-anchored ribosome-binding protein
MGFGKPEDNEYAHGNQMDSELKTELRFLKEQMSKDLARIDARFDDIIARIEKQYEKEMDELRQSLSRHIDNHWKGITLAAGLAGVFVALLSFILRAK